MSSIEDLRNAASLLAALNKFRDVLLDNDACDHILSEYDGFHDLFSVFLKDDVVLSRKQLRSILKSVKTQELKDFVDSLLKQSGM